MKTNEKLIRYLKEHGRIKTPEVEQAFRKVDRKEFVPEKHRDNAYIDRPIAIGENATISAPHIVAEVTELLEVGENDRVLEVGSGSGYQAAILSDLAEKVVGIEIDQELVKKSRKNLEGLENVEIIHTGNLEDVEGLFDRILFSCAIKGFEVAEGKLEEPGIIVAPVIEGKRQMMKRLIQGRTEELFPVRYVKFQD